MGKDPKDLESKTDFRNNIAQDESNNLGDTTKSENYIAPDRNNMCTCYIGKQDKAIGSGSADQRISGSAENYAAGPSHCQALFNDNYKILLNKFVFGNRCGHLPSVPRMYKNPKKHRRRFPIIEAAKRNLSEAYFHPLKFLIGKLFYHASKLTKKGYFRKRRSESREALTHRIGQMILHYTNLEAMMLGYPDNKSKEFHHYGIDFIAKQVGTTSIQTKRTIKIFKDAGYLEVKRRRERRSDGSFRDLPAIIKVSPQFYYDLGINEQELIKFRYKQNKQLWTEALQQKSKEHQLQIKQEKKIYKRFNKEQELPGIDRKREVTHVYRDYTGISQNREAVLKQNTTTPVAQQFLSQILSRLKIPPS